MKKAFTLAEILITLAIIGVVAAISIPSVISNSEQQQFKTGLKKAVSVLNSAISMNIALEGESPYDNSYLPQYLMRHMSILKTTSQTSFMVRTNSALGGLFLGSNGAFYTTDGMRFEFNGANDLYEGKNKLHESEQFACTATNTLVNLSKDEMHEQFGNVYCNGCGSYGLKDNPNNTISPPCLILVDVNGDRKPTPGNVDCNDMECAKTSNLYKTPAPNDKILRDIFTILITEDRAIPYGVVAQKAMYQAQK